MEIHRYIVIEEYRPKVDGKRIQAWRGIRFCVKDVRVVNPFSHLRGARNNNNIDSFNIYKIGKHPDNLDDPDTPAFSSDYYNGGITEYGKKK